FLVLGLTLGALASAGLACSGPDPGLITYSEGSSTTVNATDDPNDDPPKTKSAPAPKDAGGANANVNAVFSGEVYPALNPVCGACHATGVGGAPTFFGADVNATYPLFKQRNYDKPNSVLETKGAHEGPALTAAQKASVDKWIASEAAGG